MPPAPGSSGDPLLVVPPRFGVVRDAAVYRSAYPNSRAFSYVKTLKLRKVTSRSMVNLVPDSALPAQSSFGNELVLFAADNDIILHSVDNIGCNKEPFLAVNMNGLRRAVALVADTANHPVLVFCASGRKQTSIVVGCYRKQQNYSSSFALSEAENFGGGELGALDLQTIADFSPDVVLL